MDAMAYGASIPAPDMAAVACNPSATSEREVDLFRAIFFRCQDFAAQRKASVIESRVSARERHVRSDADV